MSNYFLDQENTALEFAELSGLPFVYTFTGGGCDAIYGETSKHRIYITDDASVPNAKAVHYVGVYRIDDDELVGECWAKNRSELLALFKSLKSLDDFAGFVIGDGFNGFANVGGA